MKFFQETFLQSLNIKKLSKKQNFCDNCFAVHITLFTTKKPNLNLLFCLNYYSSTVDCKTERHIFSSAFNFKITDNDMNLHLNKSLNTTNKQCVVYSRVT